MEEIGKSLPVVFRRHVAHARTPLAEILAPLWGQVAGQAIAAHSRPESFWDGTLTLSASSDTWAAQLRLLREELIAAVNEFTGTPVVKELRVRLAPDPVRREVGKPAPPRRPPPERAAPGELPGDLDGEIRNVLERSFIKYFGRAQRGPA